MCTVIMVPYTNWTLDQSEKILKTNSVQWTAMAQENNHGTSFAQKKEEQAIWQPTKFS